MRLFGSGTRPGGFELVEAKTSTTGVVMATYRSAGEIRGGSIAFEQPTAGEVERRRRLARSTGHTSGVGRLLVG